MEDESRGAFGPDNIQEIAYMPVKKHSPFYNMDHPRRGKAVIFNFDHWVKRIEDDDPTKTTQYPLFMILFLFPTGQYNDS